MRGMTRDVAQANATWRPSRSVSDAAETEEIHTAEPIASERSLTKNKRAEGSPDNEGRRLD